MHGKSWPRTAKLQSPKAPHSEFGCSRLGKHLMNMALRSFRTSAHGRTRKSPKKERISAKPLTSIQNLPIMQCLPAICQEVCNSILDLVAKHQANSRTNMGRIAAMLSPSRLQCHFPRIRDRMPALLEELHILQMGFWRWNGITHRRTCPKCPRQSTWHDRSRGPRG